MPQPTLPIECAEASRRSAFRTRAASQLEVVALRHQINVLRVAFGAPHHQAGDSHGLAIAGDSAYSGPERVGRVMLEALACRVKFEPHPGDELDRVGASRSALPHLMLLLRLARRVWGSYGKRPLIFVFDLFAIALGSCRGRR
jgi:hypothetical protein